MRLLMANNLAEAARAISAAAAIGLSGDHGWITCTLEDLRHAEDANPKLRTFERSPNQLRKCAFCRLWAVGYLVCYPS